MFGKCIKGLNINKHYESIKIPNKTQVTDKQFVKN